MSMDVYARITDKIVAELEKGIRPWMKPWNAEHAAGKITRPLRHNGLPYSGVNVLVLWLEATDSGYSAPIWMTYKQAQELKGQVRKGEKGSLVVYANAITKTEQNNETGEDIERKIPFMKGYTVFNVEQIDNLPAHYYAKAQAPQIDPAQRIEHLEQFFRNTGAAVRHGGNRAFFSPTHDRIQMPPFEFFKDKESYYSTLSHECTHWTGHTLRLKRDFGGKKFGDAGYAKEELVAELGAAFLCADLGITPEVREDHAAYIASWLKALKGDKRFIFSASAYAQRAAEYLHGKQPEPRAEPTPDDRPPFTARQSNDRLDYTN